MSCSDMILIMMDFARFIERNSFVTLIEEGAANREDYIGKLRLVLRELRSAVANGLILDVTEPGACIPGGEHHYHTFRVAEEFAGKVSIVVQINNFKNPSPESKKITCDKVTEIELGHPCGLVFVDYQDTSEELSLSTIAAFTFKTSAD